jgi:hypothetical protein
MRDRVEAAIGYAVSPQGDGVAYARLTGASEEPTLMRQTFRVSQSLRSLEAAGGYAALTAVARTLHERGFRNVRFFIGDVRLIEEISGRRDVPEHLVLPYVRLRCALNALPRFDVRAGSIDALTQRARAEAALNLAA